MKITLEHKNDSILINLLIKYTMLIDVRGGGTYNYLQRCWRRLWQNSIPIPDQNIQENEINGHFISNAKNIYIYLYVIYMIYIQLYMSYICYKSYIWYFNWSLVSKISSTWLLFEYTENSIVFVYFFILLFSEFFYFWITFIIDSLGFLGI